MAKKKHGQKVTCNAPDNNLIIDDDYFSSVKNYCSKAGNGTIGQMLDSYISSLKKVKEIGILSGNEAEVIDTFIEYSEKISSSKFDGIPNKFSSLCSNYITQIDEEDDYLF